MALWQRITCDSLPSHGLRLQRNRKKNRCRAGDDEDERRSLRLVDIRPGDRKPSPPPPQANRNTPDLGYNTLLSSFTSADIMSSPGFKSESESMHWCKKPTKKKMSRKTSPFEKLTDDSIAKVFSYLTTDELCAACPGVSRRWYSITWGTRSLWTQIEFGDAAVDVDKGLISVFKLLSRDFCGRSTSSGMGGSNTSQYLNYSSLKRASDGEANTSVEIPVEEVIVYSPKNNFTISDRGLLLISRKCTRLKSICLASCPNVTDIGLSDLVMACQKLARISCPGCSEIALNISRKHHRRTLQYLDVSECPRINDYSIKTFLRAYGSDLQVFFARKCTLITDAGVQSLVKFSPQLRDVSLNQCIRIADAGCRHLSKLSSSLQYLSLSKCRHVSDEGLKYLLGFQPRLRYLNVRGCSLVSDAAIVAIGTSVGNRLKALDVGKCDVTDEGLKVLSQNCASIYKLALRGCHLITDAGMASIAYNCADLIQLNIVDCPSITREGYLHVRRFCTRCLIQHSNPYFY